jgi:integrase
MLILRDTGLRVSELAQLTKQNILWQERRLAIHGKGGPYGKRSKHRVLPMTDRVRLLIEHHDTMQDNFGITARQIERMVMRVANRAGIAKPVTPAPRPAMPPENSCPRMMGKGRSSPVRVFQVGTHISSVGVTAAAWTRTSTSPACGWGCGASS